MEVKIRFYLKNVNYHLPKVKKLAMILQNLDSPKRKDATLQNSVPNQSGRNFLKTSAAVESAVATSMAVPKVSAGRCTSIYPAKAQESREEDTISPKETE